MAARHQADAGDFVNKAWFSPDGSRLAAAAGGGWLLVGSPRGDFHNHEQGDAVPIFVLDGHANPWSPDGRDVVFPAVAEDGLHLIGMGAAGLGEAARLTDGALFDTPAHREAGITIAFPQRDVHFDTSGPLEVRVVPEKRGSGKGTKEGE